MRCISKKISTLVEEKFEVKLDLGLQVAPRDWELVLISAVILKVFR